MSKGCLWGGRGRKWQALAVVSEVECAPREAFLSARAKHTPCQPIRCWLRSCYMGAIHHKNEDSLGCEHLAWHTVDSQNGCWTRDSLSPCRLQGVGKMIQTLVPPLLEGNINRAPPNASWQDCAVHVSTESADKNQIGGHTHFL